MKRFIFILLTTALVFALKLHLPVLQVVAWSGMVVKYAQAVPLAEAIEMTFDGDHPCPLCNVIRKAQTADHQEMTAPAVPERIQLFVEVLPSWHHAISAWPGASVESPRWTPVTLRPPVPPPRNAA